MNSKNIKRHMNMVMKNWWDSIEDERVRELASKNTIVTGGALVSLLTGEKPHDYDVYLRTYESALAVASYYVDQWNRTHSKHIELKTESSRISCFISSSGVVEDQPIETDKPKYRPVFVTSNAITLSNEIQVVTRFYGDLKDIHSTYDFVHCMCAWTSWDNSVYLPTKALECIINKELYYVGSQYPLCSIIRTRKYLERGWHINAGQYVKMAWQVNQLELTNIEVLQDQLCGVDTTYFQELIAELKAYSDSGSNQVDGNYLMKLIDKMF